MNKKTIRGILLLLKVSTWTCLVIACYLLINGFLQENEIENHTFKYRALIFAGIGYACNYVVKRFPKNLYSEDITEEKE